MVQLKFNFNSTKVISAIPAIMLIHITKSLCAFVMPYLYFVTYQLPEKNSTGDGLIFPLHNGESFFLGRVMSCYSVRPYMFRLTTI